MNGKIIATVQSESTYLGKRAQYTTEVMVDECLPIERAEEMAACSCVDQLLTLGAKDIKITGIKFGAESVKLLASA